MRFLVTAQLPVEAGNNFMKNPSFGEKIQEILGSHKAEHPHFMVRNGQRTCIYFVEMSDAAKIASIAEPWWLMVKANVEIIPVMGPQDLAKATPDVVAAVKKYGA